MIVFLKSKCVMWLPNKYKFILTDFSKVKIYLFYLICSLLIFLCNSTTVYSFDYPVGSPDGTGWLVNRNGIEWLQLYNYGEQCGNVYHPGHDFNKDGTTGDGDLGEPVYSVSKGKVVFSGSASWGNIILIEHNLTDGSRVWSQYAHLDTRSVNAGDPVAKRQTIGTVGKSGGQTNSHLHFEIRKNEMSADAFPCSRTKDYVKTNYINPEEFINSHRDEVAITPLPDSTTGGFDITNGRLLIKGSGYTSPTDKVIVTIPNQKEYYSYFSKLYPNQSVSSYSFDAYVEPQIGVDGSIKINIFNSQNFKWQDFLAPIEISVTKTDGTVLSKTSYPFADVSSSKGSGAAIHNLWREGIVNGKGEGYFDRTSNVTRAEFLYMVVRAKLGYSLPNFGSASSFDDIYAWDWFNPYVEYAYSQGFISSQYCAWPPTAKCFKPQLPISRWETSIIATKTFNLTFRKPDRPQWPDYNQGDKDYGYSPWIADSNDIMHGYNTPPFNFGIKDTLTRDQAAIIVNALLKRVGK